MCVCAAAGTPLQRRDYMQKAVRWAFATFFFLFCGLFLYTEISEVLRSKTGAESDMVHSFYSLERDTVDVLCLGSSHGYSSFQSNVLWDEFGITSYVMCSYRQTVASSYYLLKEALRYQKPKVVLFESYFVRIKKKYAQDSFLRLTFDGTRLGPVKYEMIEDFLGNRGLKDKLSYYIPFIKYHSRWSDLKDWDFNKKPYLHGSILDNVTVPAEDPGIPEEIDEIPETSEEYLEKIRELCLENGIQLIVYAAPYGVEDDYETYAQGQRVNNGLEAYLEERDVPFFYYQKTGEAGIDFSTDFRDNTHMNFSGAQKITRHLGHYLEGRYGLEDHRGEEGYQTWEEDFRKYERDVDLMLSEEEKENAF